MRAGSLRNKIEFHRDIEEVNEFGEKSQTFSLYTSAFASIEPIRANERIASNAEFMEITHKIRVRYASGIDSSMRIVFKNRIFDIVSIINSYERNRELEILAKEVV